MDAGGPGRVQHQAAGGDPAQGPHQGRCERCGLEPDRRQRVCICRLRASSPPTRRPAGCSHEGSPSSMGLLGGAVQDGHAFLWDCRQRRASAAIKLEAPGLALTWSRTVDTQFYIGACAFAPVGTVVPSQPRTCALARTTEQHRRPGWVRAGAGHAHHGGGGAAHQPQGGTATRHPPRDPACQVMELLQHRKGRRPCLTQTLAHAPLLLQPPDPPGLHVRRPPTAHRQPCDFVRRVRSPLGPAPAFVSLLTPSLVRSSSCPARPPHAGPTGRTTPTFRAASPSRPWAWPRPAGTRTFGGAPCPPSPTRPNSTCTPDQSFTKDWDTGPHQ